MSDVICLGELLIDLVSTETGVALIDAPAFKKAPGGAPANVAVGLAKLGVTVGFMGKVGDDEFGHFLARTLAENGVATSGLRFSDRARTTLSFIAARADGVRECMFYRHPGADMLLEPSEIDVRAIQAARIFHFGSITLIDEPSRSATLHAVETARQAGLLVSYDPNLRLSLWPSAEAARQGMMTGWPLAHVIKVNREEVEFLTGLTDLQAGASRLWHDRLKALLITDGASGAYYVTAAHHGYVPGFKVDVVDTTGAGDGFVAAFLARLLGDEALLEEPGRIEAALRYANAVGALTCTQRGAIPGLPTPAQVEAMLGRR